MTLVSTIKADVIFHGPTRGSLIEALIFSVLDYRDIIHINASAAMLNLHPLSQGSFALP